MSVFKKKKLYSIYDNSILPYSILDLLLRAHPIFAASLKIINYQGRGKVVVITASIAVIGYHTHLAAPTFY